VAAVLLVPTLAACSAPSLPTQPSPTVKPSVGVMSLEAEAGQGEGQVRSRSRASGGLTVHLAPGEYRLWTFDVGAEIRFALSVAYSNGKEGENELLTVAIDGRTVVSFQNRDSGDAVDGWNEFVTDPAGTITLGPGRHILRLESSGGDGCVELDVATLASD
jgi:hypothetical protein